MCLGLITCYIILSLRLLLKDDSQVVLTDYKENRDQLLHILLVDEGMACVLWLSIIRTLIVFLLLSLLLYVQEHLDSIE